MLQFQKITLLLMIAAFGLFSLTACSDDNNGAAIVDPDPEPATLVDIAAGDERFSTLVSVVTDLGLAETLGSEQLTVFAPTNAAFDAISDVLPNLTNEDLEQIVLYHLLAGSVLADEIISSDQTDYTTLQGEPAFIQASAAGVNINNYANVVEADLIAENGVIHAIDQVLLPTAYRVELIGPSLIEVAQEAGVFNTLIDLIDAVGLTTTLQFQNPPYTAFAPTDDAFDALFETVSAESLTPEQIAYILTYHVLVGDEVFSSDLAPENRVVTANEEPIFIVSNEDGVTVNGSANVVTADVDDAVNGVIHIIDSVLLPDPFLPVTGIVQKNYNLTTLLGLVAQREDVLAALSGSDNEFTVFAPTNEAFAEALAAYPDLTDDQITEILLYHVIAGATVLSSDLEDGATVETLQGEEITVTLGDDVLINNAVVTEADLVGSNGVVHIIDTVILPPSYTE